MKNIILLNCIFFIIWLSGCYDDDIGKCGEYIDYVGTAEILTIEQPSDPNKYSSPPCYDGYVVTYELSDNLSKLCDKSMGYFNENKWILVLGSGYLPGPEYLKKYEIEPGKIFKCTLSLQKSGPCTPCVIDLDGVDRFDYFECENERIK